MSDYERETNVIMIPSLILSIRYGYGPRRQVWIQLGPRWIRSLLDSVNVGS